MPLSSVSSISRATSEETESRYGSARNAGARALEENAMSGSDVDDLKEKLKFAHKQIKDLTDEVQRLLVEKVTLQTEVSQLKFELAGRSIDSSPALTDTRRGHEDFENVRNATKIRAELAEKDKETALWRAKCSELEQELDSIKYKISVHNDQMATTEGKKKKTWWGGTKKSKKQDGLQSSPTLLITDDLEILSQPPPVLSAKSHKGGGLSAAEMMAYTQQLQKLQKRHNEKVEELNQRILAVEREKAKADAEVELLDKERRSLQDKVSRLESVIDSLKAQHQLNNDPERLPPVKNLWLHLPANGSNEAERWKSMVQIQESALRKVATQKQELEKQLTYLSSMHGEPQNRYAMSPEIVQLREDLIAQNGLLSDSRKEVDELNMKLKSSQLKEKYLMDEVQKAKSAMAEYEHLFQNRVASQKRQQNAIVTMLGAALADNEVLQETAADYKQRYNKDAIALHGEIRALRQGRAGRMKGDAPGKPVFPSPLRAASVSAALDEAYTSRSDTTDVPSRRRHHHHHCRKNSVHSHKSAASRSRGASSVVHKTTEPDDVSVTSSSSGEGRYAPYDASLAKQYHYEWSGGAYVLKQTPPSPVDPTESPQLQAQPETREADEARDQEVARMALKNWNTTPPRHRRVE